MKKTIIMFIFYTFSLNLYGQNNEISIFGSDFFGSIALPNTWTIDMDGNFYLKEYGPNNSPAVIILNQYNKKNEDIIFEEWVENDINYFSKFYDCSILNWNIINNNNYRILIFSLRNNNEHLMYSANFDIGSNYFINLWITIIDDTKYDKIIDDFRSCLENSRFFVLE